MPSFALHGTVSRQRLTGTLEPIPNAQVWHMVERCCDTAPRSTRGQVKTNGRGEYATTFRGGDNAHYIRCDLPQGVVAIKQFIGLWVTIRNTTEDLDFLFVEPKAALPTHPCGADCSTKDSPCDRPTTNKGFCYQHKNQDIATV